jgi:multiple sugar transport system substrate-binding protein
MQRKMLKWKFILSILLVISLLTGCSKPDKRVVTFAVGGAPNEIAFWEKLVSEFESETGIKVSILRQPTDTDQRRQGLLIPLKARRDDPDVFLMDVVWIAQFGASGWLEPLDNYLEKKNLPLDQFFDRVLNLADRYKGRLIALPVYVDAGLLYYRQDLLGKYGFKNPPDTWNELLDYSLKVQKEMRKTEPDFYGFVWQGAQYEGLICNFLEFAGSEGGIIIRDDKIRLNTPENIRATQFMYDLIRKYRISPPNTFTEMKEEEVRIFFQQGKALFARNWPYAWALYQSEDSKIKDEVSISSIPHFPFAKSVSTLGGWHIGVSRYSNVKEESFALVKFVTSFATQKKLALELGWNPARKDVYADSEVLRKAPHFGTLRGVFENAEARPDLPYYSQISEVLQQNINAILSGTVSPAEGLTTSEKEAQRIMDNYKEK